MVVGKGNRLKADVFQRVQHDRFAASVERTLQRPSTVAAQDRSLEIGEGQIRRSQDRLHLFKTGSTDVARVALDE